MGCYIVLIEGSKRDKLYSWHIDHTGSQEQVVSLS